MKRLKCKSKGKIQKTLAFLLCLPLNLIALPSGFVYLNQVDPTIQQDIRYAGYHNFIGRPIQGYEKPTCILTEPAAEALKAVQKKLVPLGYSLKVYDCYRPQMAVADFYHWSQNPAATQMKGEFYPRVDKTALFKLGYIAFNSEHSSGSTVDLTIVPLPVPLQPEYTPGQALQFCYAEVGHRYRDNSIDMGTGYDCMDLRASIDNHFISKRAYQNRMMLRYLMLSNGFVPYDKEWWHFTLKNQPYPRQGFNFPVQ